MRGIEYINANTVDDGSIIGVNIASELSYIHEWYNGNLKIDARCVCGYCAPRFREAGNENEDNIGFMRRIFAEYIRDLVKVTKETYIIYG